MHTLHFDRGFTPCSHGPFVRGALFLFVPFFVISSSSLSDPSISATLARSRPRLGRQIVDIFPARSSDFSSSPTSSAGGSTLAAVGWWSSSSGSSLTTTGSLLDKSGRQLVVMAHGDTSYDDLGIERSQKTDSDSIPDWPYWPAWLLAKTFSHSPGVLQRSGAGTAWPATITATATDPATATGPATPGKTTGVAMTAGGGTRAATTNGANRGVPPGIRTETRATGTATGARMRT